ncbi:hypothetical protein GRAN_4941 [Granulicella sibirica]|uniref:Uncharacterized protein n=1 Tax=Granulicella sibirica TaxID=2479048 RepID=A0A4Q0SUG6_9BACT|nr:hypothetical protein GRAN_4941 [Granulicella sibirica]
MNQIKPDKRNALISRRLWCSARSIHVPQNAGFHGASAL